MRNLKVGATNKKLVRDIKVGELTIVKSLPWRNGQIYYLCQCSCGREVEVAGTNLSRIKNRKTACGKAGNHLRTPIG